MKSKVKKLDERVKALIKEVLKDFFVIWNRLVVPGLFYMTLKYKLNHLIS